MAVLLEEACGRAALRSTPDRALELDPVAFGIGQINRRPLALGAVARRLFAAFCAVRGEMSGDRGGVERLDPQAQMIEIGATARRAAVRRPRLIGGNDVDQRLASAQLRQLALALLEGAAEHLEIEALQRRRIG